MSNADALYYFVLAFPVYMYLCSDDPDSDGWVMHVHRIEDDSVIAPPSSASSSVGSHIVLWLVDDLC